MRSLLWFDVVMFAINVTLVVNWIISDAGTFLLVACSFMAGAFCIAVVHDVEAIRGSATSKDVTSSQ